MAEQGMPGPNILMPCTIKLSSHHANSYFPDEPDWFSDLLLLIWFAGV